MIITDTHLHLYSEEYKDDVQELIHNAREKNITRFFLPNIDVDSIKPLALLLELFPKNCFGMMGLHPCYVKENYLEELKLIRDELNKKMYIAIGEIGIDLYWDKTTFEIQKNAFNIQCEWAMELNLPIAIHCRESLSETINLVRSLKLNHPQEAHKLRGVFHCFSGTVEEANQIIELGFYLGIGGVVTFKNSIIAKTIVEIDLNKVLLETDGPYLAPMPFRGKRNEPSYIYYVAQKLAELKGISIEEVARVTTLNSINLFGV